MGFFARTTKEVITENEHSFEDVHLRIHPYFQFVQRIKVFQDFVQHHHEVQPFFALGKMLPDSHNLNSSIQFMDVDM